MPDLKLAAFDAEDLRILSAHLQDAVLRVADLAYLPREKRFAAILNRFDWLTAVGEVGASEVGTPKQPFERRRAGLRFERVLDAKLSHLDLTAKDQCLALLAVDFAQAEEPPGGFVTLHFAGGPAIRLTVECIEAELRDLGAAWATRSKPCHPDETLSPISKKGV